MYKTAIQKFLFVALIACVSLSCSDSLDGYDEYYYSDGWKAFQKDYVVKVSEAKNSDGTLMYQSKAADGSSDLAYFRPTDYITKRMQGDFEVKPPEALPTTRAILTDPNAKPTYLTDKVTVRYEGWYFNKDNERTVFDTTEGYNNNKSAEFTIGGVIPGFRTVLMDMVVGEERLACFSYQLGYGATGTNGIPPYTTLFFDIKLLKIDRPE